MAGVGTQGLASGHAFSQLQIDTAHRNYVLTAIDHAMLTMNAGIAGLAMEATDLHTYALFKKLPLRELMAQLSKLQVRGLLPAGWGWGMRVGFLRVYREHPTGALGVGKGWVPGLEVAGRPAVERASLPVSFSLDQPGKRRVAVGVGNRSGYSPKPWTTCPSWTTTPPLNWHPRSSSMLTTSGESSTVPLVGQGRSESLLSGKYNHI